MTLDDLKRTVARTTGPQIPAGTAFLVSPTHALTCAHCVVDDAGHGVEDVDLYFSVWDGVRERRAKVESLDTERDVALLQLSEPAPVPPCPRTANTINGALWQAFGHPNPTGNHGITIGGDVVDINARTGQKVERQVIQLQCHEAQDNVHGASGSPVFVGGSIVGMITNQVKMWGKTGADGKREIEPAYGALFALSMAQIAASPGIRTAIDWHDIDDSSPDSLLASERTEAELLQHYLQIIESIPKLSSIKVPGSSGAIETVPLDSIYIEPAVSGLTRLDDIWSRQRVAIVGEEGLGKGAFLKHLNLRLLREANHATEKLLWPLHIELDRYAKQGDRADLLDFALDDLLGRGEKKPLRLHLEACNRDGRLVLLCDGLEHVGSDYERVVDALSRQRRFVVALRPGHRMDVGQESGATLRLQPFDQRRIQAFIGKWADTIAPRKRGLDEKRVMREIANQSALLDLARTPRFLGLICSVISGGGTLVPTRTALISTAWDTVWQATFGGESFSRRRAAAKALETLARKGFERGASGSQEFGEEELYETLELAGERNPDNLVARLIECEIIAPAQDSGYASRSFRFPLESFQEYLAAEHLANDENFLNALPGLKLDSRWAKILPVVTGILGRNDNRLPALRDFLAALSKLESGEAFGLHVCLVAECLAEVHPDLFPSLAPFPEQTAAELLRVWKEQPITRNYVMPSLRRLQPAAVRSGLREIIADHSSPVDQRAAAAIALSAFRDRETLETLIDLVSEDDAARVRVAACLGLTLVEHEDGDTALVGALMDRDLQVQSTAALCISRRGDRKMAGRVLEAWLENAPLRLKVDNDFLQGIASLTWALVIAKLRPEATLPALLNALTQGETSEQMFAMQVFAMAGMRAGVWPGITILESSGVDPSVKRVAAQMMIRLGTEAAFTALRQAFDRHDDSVKLGAFEGFTIKAQEKESPVADIFSEPTDTSFTWSVIRPIEMELFEAQTATTLKILQTQVAQQGLKTVLSNARDEFAHIVESTQGPPQEEDFAIKLGNVFSSEDDDLRRLAAFETIQLLEGDPELLVNGLFDSDLKVAFRAVAWVRLRHAKLPLEFLLERMDAAPGNAADLNYWAIVSALGRLEHLTTLVEHYRAGSRTAAYALWLMSVQFGFHLYEDGRIELPDKQVETDYERAADRLRHLDEATARQSSKVESESMLSFEAARGEFMAALGSEPQDGPGWASLAVFESFLGKAERSVTSLEFAIKVDGKTPLWHRFRGSLHYDTGDYEGAALDYERAIELGDVSPSRFVNLGDACLGHEQFERAARAFSTALDTAPDNSDALYGRAQARFELSLYAEAAEDLKVFLGKDPANARAVKLLARANAALGGHDAEFKDLASIDAAEAGMLVQPSDAELWDSYLARARQYISDGELDAAFTDAERVIIANPFHPSARVLRARIWVEKGYPEFAIFDLTDLVARCVDEDMRDALASALDELVELRGMDAPAALTDRQRADAVGVRGAVFAALGALDRARADLEEAVAAGAKNWQILNTLAWLYADHFEVNLEQASHLAQDALNSLSDAALATDEDRGSVFHSLGWSYYKRGLHDEAQTALEKAASLCPDNAEISKHRDLVKNVG